MQVKDARTHLFCHSPPISCTPGEDPFFCNQPSMPSGFVTTAADLADISIEFLVLLPPPKKPPNKPPPPVPFVFFNLIDAVEVRKNVRDENFDDDREKEAMRERGKENGRNRKRKE